MKLRSLLTLPCLAAALGLAGVAHADIVTGGVYTTAPFPAGLSPLETPPGTFLGGFSIDAINFFSATTGPNYTVLGFLTSNGATVTGLNAGVGAMTLDNKELKFTGTTYLQAGVTYTINHDDGVYLYLGGNPIPVVASGAPTSPAASTFTVATSGAYSFDLLYAEVNSAPATLNYNGPLQSPEPSSFILLGSGLLAAAGAVRRRLMA